MWLRQRFKGKKDVSKPAHNYDTPETHPDGAADSSTYQELELKNRQSENSYQASSENEQEKKNEQRNKDWRRGRLSRVG